jgi:hypothetical protein
MLARSCAPLKAKVFFSTRKLVPCSDSPVPQSAFFDTEPVTTVLFTYSIVAFQPKPQDTLVVP